MLKQKAKASKGKKTMPRFDLLPPRQKPQVKKIVPEKVDPKSKDVQMGTDSGAGHQSK